MEKQETQAQSQTQSPQQKLDSEMRNIIEEARVILPGVQALFGFQTIAVFNERFDDLEGYAKACHVLALAMVILTVAMIMTPAIYYRACDGKSTRHMAKVASVMIRGGLIPLALGLALDVFTVLFVVTSEVIPSVAAGIASLVVFGALWYALPAHGKKHYQR
jgi:hypothetical protein